MENAAARKVFKAIFDPLAAVHGTSDGTEIYEEVMRAGERHLVVSCYFFVLGANGLLKLLGPDRAAAKASALLQAGGVVKTRHKRGPQRKGPYQHNPDARRHRLRYERQQRAAQLAEVAKNLEEVYMKHPDPAIREYVRQEIRDLIGRKGG
jgi:hypothetical protein